MPGAEIPSPNKKTPGPGIARAEGLRSLWLICQGQVDQNSRPS
jgi:hypothetical protein